MRNAVAIVARPLDASLTTAKMFFTLDMVRLPFRSMIALFGQALSNANKGGGMKPVPDMVQA